MLFQGIKHKVFCYVQVENENEYSLFYSLF